MPSLIQRCISYLKNEYDYKTDLLIYSNPDSKYMPDLMVFHNRREDLIINTNDSLHLNKVEVIKYCGIAFFIGKKDEFGFQRTKSYNMLKQNNWYVCEMENHDQFKAHIDNYMKMKLQKIDVFEIKKGIDYFNE